MCVGRAGRGDDDEAVVVEKVVETRGVEETGPGDGVSWDTAGSGAWWFMLLPEQN